MNTDVKKMNKTGLTEVLNLNFSEVKKTDKSLADRIIYTAKSYKADEKSVTKKDLLDLVNEVSESLGDKFLLEAPAEKSETPKVESQTKKLKAKPSKKDEEKKPEAESEPVEEPEEEKPAGKKTSSSKKPEKKSAVKTQSAQELMLAQVFSDTITLDDGSKYQIAHDIKNMDDLMKAYDNEETVVFAMYWTKRHLAQFGYFNDQFEAPEDGFPLDLDLASCIYVSEEGVVAYATSLYTEGCYMFQPKDFEEFDGIRFSGGIEFQIYRKVEEPEEEE